MSTTVQGRVVRSVGLGNITFSDLTDAPVASVTRTGVTFDGDLTDEQTYAVWERMTSKDDADQAARAALRAADGATNLPEMLRAYVLADPMPDPTYAAAHTEEP